MLRFARRSARAAAAASDSTTSTTSAIRFNNGRRRPLKPSSSFPLAILPKPEIINSVRHTVEMAPPAQLTDKLHKLLEPHSLRKLTHDFDVLTKETAEFELSESCGKIPRYDSRRSLAYMAFRMAPAFGCISAALLRVRDVGFSVPLTNQRPITVLDFGSGPGTASWAVWDTLIKPNKDTSLSKGMEATFIENSLPMIDAAKRLAEGTFEANWARNLLELSRSYTRKNSARYDVVIASFSLGDLASNEAREVMVDMLWSFVRADGGLLVLMERGTPRGSRIVGQARKQILEGGSREYDSSSLFKPDYEHKDEEAPVTAVFPHVLAPCGHERTCPLLESDSQLARFKTNNSSDGDGDDGVELANAAPTSMHCHFAQSTARLLKTTTSSRASHFMSYSYACIQKCTQPSTPDSRHQQFVRVLAPPKRRMNHVIMDICGEQHETVGGGIRQTITTKRDGKLRYRRARKAQAGDLFPRRR